LSPRSASRLVAVEGAVRTKLVEGTVYALWGSEERFTFVEEVLALLSQVPSFRIGTRLGRRRSFTDWSSVLRWWLAKSTLRRQPNAGQITSWYDFVSQNFIYRGAWGIGSIIGLLMDLTEDGQPVRALEIDDWPRSGLPWIAFWIKEIITWGTLDPVAAYLLARGEAIDRPQAERDANVYYQGVAEGTAPNDFLDPRRIRDWVQSRRPIAERPASVRQFVIDADLLRPAANYRSPRLTVAPIETNDTLTWIDPAGYSVAKSSRPQNWPEATALFDFELAVQERKIFGETYLRYT